jgi:hypothetical protein
MPTKDLNILGLKVTTPTNQKSLSIVTGYNSYVQKIEHICKTQKGELPSDMNLGSDYFNFLFDPAGNKNFLQTNLENYIQAAVYEIRNVKVLVSSFTQTKIYLIVNFSLTDSIKEQISSCTVEVDI